MLDMGTMVGGRNEGGEPLETFTQHAMPDGDAKLQRRSSGAEPIYAGPRQVDLELAVVGAGRRAEVSGDVLVIIFDLCSGRR